MLNPVGPHTAGSLLLTLAMKVRMSSASSVLPLHSSHDGDSGTHLYSTMVIRLGRVATSRSAFHDGNTLKEFH